MTDAFAHRSAPPLSSRVQTLPLQSLPLQTRLLTALLIVIVTGSVFAQTTLQPKDDQSNRLAPIDLGQSSPDAEQTFHKTLHELKQSLDTLGAPAPTFAGLQQAQARYRNTPSESHRAGYAEAHALALQSVYERLQGFLSHRRRFQDAYVAYKQFADSRIQALERERTQLAESQGQLAEVASKYESLLGEVSAKCESLSRENKPLPQKVQDLVADTELKIRLTKRKAELQARYQEKTTTQIAHWKESLEAAQRFERKMNRSFTAAAGDSELLELLAGLQRRELDARSLALPTSPLADYDLNSFMTSLLEGLDFHEGTSADEASKAAANTPSRFEETAVPASDEIAKQWQRTRSIYDRIIGPATFLERDFEAQLAEAESLRQLEAALGRLSETAVRQAETGKAEGVIPVEASRFPSRPRTQVMPAIIVPPGIDKPEVELPPRNEVPPVPLRRAQ